MIKRYLWIPVLLMLCLTTGCATLNTWLQPADEEEQPAQALAVEGMEEFASREYKRAIKKFEMLKDRYPFSKYAILAELKTADAHFMLKEYEEAAFAYEEFESLHPKNEAIPYVIYQMGMCSYNRIDSIDRDQGSARKALETFEQLKKLYPEDPHAKKAENLISACYRSISGHEFYVGEYYFKNGNYAAAINRFQSILENYPDEGIHKQVMQYITLCQTKIDSPAPE